MKLGNEDESGRRRPIPVKGSEYVLSFDTIITAIGQDIFLDFVDESHLRINVETNETQIPSVFAGGDVLRGADSLINAMGDGKKSAENIIKRATGNYKITEPELTCKMTPVEYQKNQAHREFGSSLPVLDEETAKREAARCLFCEDVCNICIGVCPNFSNVSFEAEKNEIPIWHINKKENDISIKKVDSFIIKQGNQIFNIGDFCNECGNCDTFCPTNGAPYKTKPHFYLTEESFNSEEIGYYLNNNSLKFKSKGGLELLSFEDDFLIYESNEVVVKFDQNDFSVSEIEFKSGKANEVELRHAAEMYFLLKSLKDYSLFN
jgi:putative selenate reductase